MTEQQIVEQLKRLTMFGNLQQDEVTGYLKVLRGSEYTYLVNAIDFLIANHERRYYPLPADIMRAYKKISRINIEQAEDEKRSSHGPAHPKRLAAFLGALGEAMKCFPDDWHRLQKKILSVNSTYGDNPANEERVIFEMNAIKNEAARLFHTRGGEKKFKKCIPGPLMGGPALPKKEIVAETEYTIPEMAPVVEQNKLSGEDDLPF